MSGAAVAEQGNLDEAVACYRRAMELKPDHVDAHLNHALALLLMGRFDEAWPEYEWRLKSRGMVGQSCQNRVGRATNWRAARFYCVANRAWATHFSSSAMPNW